jgi:hypothetical protein
MNHNQHAMAMQHLTSTPINRHKRQRMGSNACPKCEQIIYEDVEHLSCCICELKFCSECTNISLALRQALKEYTSQNFKWASCNGCKQNFPCMTGLSLQLKSIEEKTHNRISILERRKGRHTCRHRGKSQG